MKRLWLIVLLPVIWFPILAALLLAIPALPWWSWVVALVFLLLLRRRRSADPDPGLAEGGVSWSPTRRGGGLW